MAYTIGNAAKIAPAPVRSQTSLPSQTGPMEARTTLFSSSPLAMNG